MKRDIVTRCGEVLTQLLAFGCFPCSLGHSRAGCSVPGTAAATLPRCMPAVLYRDQPAAQRAPGLPGSSALPSSDGTSAVPVLTQHTAVLSLSWQQTGAGLWATFTGCVRGGEVAVQVTAERQCCGYLGVYGGHRVTAADEFSNNVWHRVSGCGNATQCHEGFWYPSCANSARGQAVPWLLYPSSSSEGMDVSSSLKCAEQTMAWSE